MKTKEQKQKPGRPMRVVVDPESAAAKLGAEIQRRRKTAGLSGRDLASAAGVGVTTLYDAEAGVSTPTIAVLARIDRALHAGNRLVSFAFKLEW